MNYFLTILEITITPLMAFFGVLVANRTKKKEGQDQAFTTCKKQHNDNLEKVKADFNKKLDDVNEKLDKVNTQISDMLLANQHINDQIESLTNECRKHNSVIERTFKLEERCSVLENREKVSENRLSDLERHEEQKQIK